MGTVYSLVLAAQGLAAQISPQDGAFLNPSAAQGYLVEYFRSNKNPEELSVDIYWGEARDFLVKLVHEWEKRVRAEDG